jgi:hypothetical protein
VKKWYSLALVDSIAKSTIYVPHVNLKRDENQELNGTQGRQKSKLRMWTVK